MSARSTDRAILGVNVMVLRNGTGVHLDDIATASDGQAILDDLDGAILSIEDQLAFDDGSKGALWRKRADKALRRKRRQRPALQQRIGELRGAEKQAEHEARADQNAAHLDVKRRAFIKAAEELLAPELLTEVWARAAEREPAAFAKADGGAA